MVLRVLCGGVYATGLLGLGVPRLRVPQDPGRGGAGVATGDPRGAGVAHRG